VYHASARRIISARGAKASWQRQGRQLHQRLLERLLVVGRLVLFLLQVLSRRRRQRRQGHGRIGVSPLRGDLVHEAVGVERHGGVGVESGGHEQQQVREGKERQVQRPLERSPSAQGPNYRLHARLQLAGF